MSNLFDFQVIIGQAAVHRCNATVDFRQKDKPFFPATINNNDLHNHFVAVTGDLFGTKTVYNMRPLMGSEDFSFYQEVIPGYFSFLGVGDGTSDHYESAHSPYFKINEDGLPYGVALHASLATGYILQHRQKIPLPEGRSHSEL